MTTTPIKSVVAAPAAPERMTVAARRGRGSSRTLRKRLQLRDAARQDWEIRLQEDETLADVERPEFFGASADRLSKGDRIAIVSFTPGAEFLNERMVISVDVLLQVASTVQIAHVDLAQRVAAMTPPDLSKVVVENVSGDVWRLRQGQHVVATGFKSRAEANKSLDELKNGQKASSPSPV